MKKVAIVYHFFAHYRGGVMRALLDTSEYEYIFVGDRMDPTDPYRSIKEWRAPKERFVLTPCVRFLGNLLWQRRLLKLSVRPDIYAVVFLGNANFISTWLAALVARLTGKRVLFWTHGWTRRDRGLKRIGRRVFYAIAHGLLLYGNRARMIGLEEGFPSASLYVVYNSLDYETQKATRDRVTKQRLQEIRRQYCTRSAGSLLIFVGRLVKNCRLELLLEAMARLKAEGVGTGLLLVGDGPEKEFLQQRAKTLGLPVSFYGACYDERTLAELLMAANVTVSPGKVGLTAMHSLAYGTPVITHDDADSQMPEFEAIVPGKTGELFRRNEVEDLCKAIKKWVDLPWPDEAIRRECHLIIDRFYNPMFQRSVINRAVAGIPAEEPGTGSIHRSHSVGTSVHGET